MPNIDMCSSNYQFFLGEPLGLSLYLKPSLAMNQQFEVLFLCILDKPALG